jgi:hypothetical protein
MEAAVLPILCLMLAAAQPQPTSPPSAPLAGPTVATHVTCATLVSYDMSGRLRRLDTAPEQAALALLDLPADARARADAVVAERAAAIDRFVSDNLLLLSQLDTATKAGNALDKTLTLLQAYGRVRPVLQGGPLRDRIIAALPPPHAERFRAVFDEYWTALVSDSLNENHAQGKHDQRWQVDLGERFNHLGQEVARSFERQSASGTIFVDYLLADLDLTPDQRQIVQTLKMDMLERTNLRPTEEDQKRLGLGILSYLNERQRIAVLKRITGR